MKKRFLGILITLIMMLGILPLAATAAEITPVTPPLITSSTYKELGFSDSEWKAFDGYYAIHNEAELEGYRQLLLTKKAPINVILRKDIQISQDSWTPLYNIYGGVFDGNGMKIENIYVGDYQNPAQRAGFFDRAVNMTIKNLWLSRVNIYGRESTGGLTAYAENCEISNCFISSNSSITSAGTVQDEYGADVGGFVGHLYKSTLKDCVFEGEVVSHNTSLCCGTIAGVVAGSDVSGCYYYGGFSKYMLSDGSGWVSLNFSIGKVNIGDETEDKWGTKITTFEDILNHTCMKARRVAYIAKCGETGYDSREICLFCGNRDGGKSTATHKYSSDCSSECNICGEEREAPANHTYSSVCDKDCDVCGEERTVEDHTWADANCAIPKHCTVCGEMVGDVNPDAHDWSNKNGICANNCGLVCDHTGHKDGVCGICGHVCSHSYGYTVLIEPGCSWEGVGKYLCFLCDYSYLVAIPVKHGKIISGGDAGDGTHNMVCEDCGDIMEKVPHSFEDGYCTVCNASVPNPAAVVIKNGQETGYYATLQEAFDKLENSPASDEAVVKLLRDIDLGNSRVVIRPGVITLDLNGKILSGNSDCVLFIKSNRDNQTIHITVEDSATGGAISGNGSCGIDILYNQSLSFPPDVDITVNSGTVSGNRYGIYHDDRGCIEINGGTVVGQNKTAIYSYRSDIVINGGTVVGKNGYAVSGYKNADVTINGGTIDGIISFYHGTINGGNFPGGIQIEKTHLDDALGRGMAYWQDGVMLSVNSSEYEIKGGDVTVKPICTHDSFEKIDFTDKKNNETHTYYRTCCYNKAVEEHTWNEDNVCEYCYAGKPFKFYFMDGDAQLFTADVNAHSYHNFKVAGDKNNLSFLGWDEDGDGIADYAGLDLPYYIYVEGDKTFNAVYGNVYLIRYHRIGLDSGEYEISNIAEYPENSVLSLDYDYTYWYTPLGWATEPGGEKVYDYGEEITVTGSLNLYTVWEPFTVTFDIGEGASWVDENGTPVPESITEDRDFYTAPVKPGYILRYFVGEDQYGNEITYEFNTDEETGERWMYVSLSSTMTLTAVWEECPGHNYVNGKCECGAVDNTIFAITGFDKASSTVTINIPQTGTYSLIFADFEGERLNDTDIVTFAADKVGEITIPIENGISLDKDDKIMLWADVTNPVPMCEAYIIK